MRQSFSSKAQHNKSNTRRRNGKRTREMRVIGWNEIGIQVEASHPISKRGQSVRGGVHCTGIFCCYCCCCFSNGGGGGCASRIRRCAHAQLLMLRRISDILVVVECESIENTIPVACSSSQKEGCRRCDGRKDERSSTKFGVGGGGKTRRSDGCR